jgi:hypothetical protein
VTADQISLSNGSRISTIRERDGGSAGNITFNAAILSATDSVIDASVSSFTLGRGGTITIQGLQGSGTYAHRVSIRNTQVSTGVLTDHLSGPITIRGDNISLNHTTLSSYAANGLGGPITLVSRGGLGIEDSLLRVSSDLGNAAGTVDLRAGTTLNLTNTNINANSGFSTGGSITMAAPCISIRGGLLTVFSGTDGGMISITGKNAVMFTNGTVLTADGSNNGGTVLINGGARFGSQQSTISAQALPMFCDPACSTKGGTIHVGANKIDLTDSQLNTSTSGGPGTAGGSITLDAKNTTLTNSEILSTATEGTGGTISITSPRFHQDASSVIDASSQLGIDGTMTINGVIQP